MIQREDGASLWIRTRLEQEIFWVLNLPFEHSAVSSFQTCHLEMLKIEDSKQINKAKEQRTSLVRVEKGRGKTTQKRE